MRLSSNKNGCNPVATGLLLSACTVVFLSSSAVAEEVAAFRLLDYDGSLSLRYMTDKQEIENQGVTIQKSERPVWQEELSIYTNSYIYHPNFLKIGLGVDLIYDQSEFDSLVTSYEQNEQLVNLSARMDFLSRRPYPFSLFYNKETPTVSTGLSGSYMQENEKYGADVSLLKPFFPVQMKLSAFRQTMTGAGADQIIDDEIEQAKLDIYQSYGVANTLQITHQVNDRVSRSGSTYLPIVERETSVVSTDVNARNVFGSSRQFKMVNTMGYREQDEHPQRKEWTYVPHLNWKHNENISSFYRLEFDDTEAEDFEVENKKARTGLVYNDQLLSSSLDVYLQRNQSTGFEFEDRGSRFNFSNSYDAGYGNYKFNYNAHINVRDQVSEINLVPVYGDEYVLSGLSEEDLGRENIDIKTIVVSNLTRTQTFVDGLDYRIIVVGTQTYVQRLAGGSITDGQSVLIDYSYVTGGSYQYRQFIHSVYVNLAIAKYYDIYMKYYQTDQSLEEGIPTIQLNSVDGILVGARVDRPLQKEVSVGGEVYAEVHDEDINPFDKQNLDMFIKLPLPAMTSLRLSSRWLRVDNENSNEDVDLRSLILRLHARPWLRVKMSFESSYEKDTGGSVERQLRNNNLRFDWNYRQLSFQSYIRYQSEEQGIIQRDRWSLNLQLRRAF